MSSKNVLAISSSRVGNSTFLEPAIPFIKDFLGGTSLNIAFIPFAGIVKSHHQYLAVVQEGLRSLNHNINLVTQATGTQLLAECDAIMVGGGNTFKLLHDIYKFNFLEIIQKRVLAGTPYIGWSAGANITGKTICTTNDMPIIEPDSFNALNFFPFQINPHYLNVKPEGHNGETRDERLIEFIKVNPHVPVVGLPEGSALVLRNGKVHFIGEQSGVLFTSARDANTVKNDINAQADLSYLM